MEQAALLGAVQVLAAAASPDTLRRILHQLVDDLAPDAPVPDTKTPANEGDHAAGEVWQTNYMEAPKAETAAPRTIRKASTPHPTRPDRSAANGSAERLTVSQWLAFREMVNKKMLAEGLDLAQLGNRLGYSTATVKSNMRKRSPPSAPIAAKLQAFIAGSTGGNGAASSNGNGVAAVQREAAALFTLKPDDAKALAARLRAKRRPIALTSVTLASQIGVEPDELDNALHGRPVPPQAAERLTAWATAG